jgi:separase
VALRREMLEAIDKKLDPSPRPSRDDLAWPELAAPSAHTVTSEIPFASYWSSVRDRYHLPAEDYDESFRQSLPAGSNVVSIHVSYEEDSLLLVRHCRDREPLVFRLPFDRVGRRDDEDELFTLAVAREELTDIVQRNNEGTKRAKDIGEGSERVAWWRERRELDGRLGNLIANIEHRWLGAFKVRQVGFLMDCIRPANSLRPLQSALIPPPDRSAESRNAFRTTLERILRRATLRPQDRETIRIRLEESIVECFSGLPPTCPNEDVEDLLHFAMETFQFSGVPVTCDEVDVDQVRVVAL